MGWPVLLVLGALSMLLFSGFRRSVDHAIDEVPEGETPSEAERKAVRGAAGAASTALTALVLAMLWGIAAAGHFKLAVALALVGGFLLSYFSRASVDRG